MKMLVYALLPLSMFFTYAQGMNQLSKVYPLKYKALLCLAKFINAGAVEKAKSLEKLPLELKKPMEELLYMLKSPNSTFDEIVSIPHCLKSLYHISPTLVQGFVDKHIFSLINSPSSLNELLLHMAYKGDLDTLRALLALGADPNFIGNAKMLKKYWPEHVTINCLKIAVDQGNIALVSVLLECGANPNSAIVIALHEIEEGTISIEGTPSMIAVLQKNKEMVRTLLEGKAQAEIKDLLSQTPLLYAVKGLYEEPSSLIGKFVGGFVFPLGEEQVCLPIIQLLLEAGANPNTQDRVKRDTALHIAVRSNALETVKLIIQKTKYPLNLSLRNSNDESVLDIARKNSSAVAQLLEGIQSHQAA
jgi:hypothetical protein